MAHHMLTARNRYQGVRWPTNVMSTFFLEFNKTFFMQQILIFGTPRLNKDEHQDKFFSRDKTFCHDKIFSRDNNSSISRQFR